MNTIELLQNAIVNYPGFPKPGIQFKDLNPIYRDAALFTKLVEIAAEKAAALGSFDYVAGIEARGFILGTALARHLGAGFIPVRKQGKLPGELERVSYTLEYGTDTLEVQKDPALKNASVLIVDDVFATGGTLTAVAGMLQGMAGSVACLVIMDIQIADISLPGIPYAVILS